MTVREENLIRFGASGNSEAFYAQGFKSTWQAPAWLAEMGLNAYEYSFGRGVSMSDETALRIAEQMKKYGIAVSVHAPYFINLANSDPEKREASFRYITESARLVRLMGGSRVVVHTGAVMKLTREEALENCRRGLREAYERLDGMGLSAIRLCPETMGKYSQIGDLAEVLSLCQMDERLIPCVDFAHLHALGQGALNTEKDFAAVLDTLENALGMERARAIHIHFSTIEFTAAGEKRHRTFAEPEFGPRFEQLAPLLWKRGYAPRVICESKGTMAEDALTMKRIYEAQKKE